MITNRYVHGASVDERLVHWQYDQNTGAELKEQFYHRDHQGSIIAMSDTSGGRAVGELYTYDAYGNQVTGSTTGQPFRYTGRRYDAETGLYYYRARYYSSELGRFLQTDPIGYEDQMNLYGYVGNDPINNTDASGLICTSASRIEGGGGSAACSGGLPEQSEESSGQETRSGEASQVVEQRTESSSATESRPQASSRYAITDFERRAAAEGNRRAFWASRALKGDPQAKIANEAIQGKGVFIGGERANTRLRAFSRVHGNREIDIHQVGIRIMQAHVQAIDADRLDVVGLLNPSQVAAYHHEVFAEFGLPSTTFGGTPFTGTLLEAEFTAPIWCGGCDE